MRRVAVVASLLMLNACVVKTKTDVIQDGFMAHQKTVAEHRQFVEAGDTWYTKCRYDQLMLHKADNRYYCPPESSKEAYDSHVTGPYISQAMIDRMLPVLGSAAFLGGTLGGAAILSGGLQSMPSSNVTQQAFPGSKISTFNSAVQYVPIN
jgi:hypothetical protein